VLSNGKKTGVTATKTVIINAIIIEKKVKNRKTIKEIMVIITISFAPRRKSSIHTAIQISCRRAHRRDSGYICRFSWLIPGLWVLLGRR